MVDSPEYRHRHRGTRGDLRLGRKKIRTDALHSAADFFLLRPATHVRVPQWPDTRSERRLSLQRAYGAAPPAHVGSAAAAARWSARVDATSSAFTTWYRPGCTLLHPGAHVLRRLHARDSRVASAAV